MDLTHLYYMQNDVVVYYGDFMVIIMVNIFSDIVCYGESCIMVYELWSKFGVLWSGGMDWERVVGFMWESVKRYLW